MEEDWFTHVNKRLPVCGELPDEPVLLVWLWWLGVLLQEVEDLVHCRDDMPHLRFEVLKSVFWSLGLRCGCLPSLL